MLADAQGFLIAGAGESVAQEGLAAFAAVAGEMVSRARMLLPMAEVDSLRVVDRNSMVLTCHLFESAGEGLGVATLALLIEKVASPPIRSKYAANRCSPLRSSRYSIPMMSPIFSADWQRFNQ